MTNSYSCLPPSSCKTLLRKSCHIDNYKFDVHIPENLLEPFSEATDGLLFLELVYFILSYSVLLYIIL